MGNKLSLEEKLFLNSKKTLDRLTNDLLNTINKLEGKNSLSPKELIKINELSLSASIAEQKYNFAFTYLFYDPLSKISIIDDLKNYKTERKELVGRMISSNKKIKKIRNYLKEKGTDYNLKTTEEWSKVVNDESVNSIYNRLESKKEEVNLAEIYNFRKQAAIGNILYPKELSKSESNKSTSKIDTPSYIQ